MPVPTQKTVKSDHSRTRKGKKSAHNVNVGKNNKGLVTGNVTAEAKQKFEDVVESLQDSNKEAEIAGNNLGAKCQLTDHTITADFMADTEQEGAETQKEETRSADQIKISHFDSDVEETRNEKILMTLELAKVELQPMPKGSAENNEDSDVWQPLEESENQQAVDEKDSEVIAEIVNAVVEGETESNGNGVTDTHIEVSRDIYVDGSIKVDMSVDDITVTEGENSESKTETQVTLDDKHSTHTTLEPDNELEHSESIQADVLSQLIKGEAQSPSPLASNNTDQSTETIRSTAQQINLSRSNEPIMQSVTGGVSVAQVNNSSLAQTVNGHQNNSVEIPIRETEPQGKNMPINGVVINSDRKLSIKSLLTSQIEVAGDSIDNNVLPTRKPLLAQKKIDEKRLLEANATHTLHQGKGNDRNNRMIQNKFQDVNKCPRHSRSANDDSNKQTTPRKPLRDYERPFSRKELRRALPRKSTFNCHDTAMKDAGFEDDSVAQRKAQRIKERLARVSSSLGSGLLGTSKFLTTPDSLPNVQVVVTDTNDHDPNKTIDTVAANNAPGENKVTNQNGSSEGDVPDMGFALEDQNHTLLGTDITEESFTGETSTNGGLGLGVGGGFDGLGLVGSTRRRRPGSARVEYVECKPLSQYLEYVRDNKQEYLNYLQHQEQQQEAARFSKPVATLIKMGRAFELRHQGGTSCGKKSSYYKLQNLANNINNDGEESESVTSDIIVMAAKALRPRSVDPGRFGRHRDKSGLRRGTERPVSEDRRSLQDKSPGGGSHGQTPAPGTAHHKEEEHHKTELEKRKLKAEDWTRGVSTNTLTKARIQSLRELGAEDTEMTKWWEAFRGCHYLRIG